MYQVNLQARENPKLTELTEMSEWRFYQWETFNQMAKQGLTTPSLIKYRQKILDEIAHRL